jgi:hypothetical protein
MKKRWKVVKDANDKYSDREWEDVKVVVVEEEKMVSLVVVVVEAQWKRSKMKAKPSQENQ